MPAIGTIHTRSRRMVQTGRPQVRHGIPMAIYAVETALNRLEHATEKPAPTLEAIEVLGGILDTLRSLEGQPIPTLNAYGVSLALNFRTVHGLLKQAGLESGGLHDCLHSAEAAIRQAQSGQLVRA